jgi:hypothetical protein
MTTRNATTASRPRRVGDDISGAIIDIEMMDTDEGSLFVFASCKVRLDDGSEVVVHRGFIGTPEVGDEILVSSDELR